MNSQELLLAQIRKEFGENSMFLLGREERLMDIKVRTSGSLLLDIALGGGYPYGKIIELSGREKSGKTTLLCMAIAEAQKNEPEKETAIIDLEHTFNPEWAKKLGVDLDRLFFAQPDFYAEKVFDLLEYLVKSKKFSIVGLDSLAGLITKSEYEMDDWEKENRVGGTSRLNAQMIRKIVNSGLLTASETTFVCINQLRDKIGAFSLYGTPTTTPGGRSIKHAYAQQLEVTIGDFFTKGSGASKEFLGQQIKVKVAKNKIAPPYKVATIDLYYDYGIDKLMELINVAKYLHVLSGTSWLRVVDPETGEVLTDSGGGELKFNGVVKTKEFLIDDIENNNGEVFTYIQYLVQKSLRGDSSDA